MTRFVIVALLLTGCEATGTFQCDSNDDCRQRGEPGTCQTSVGHCSFPDETCASGQRFSSNSGPDSDQCYGDSVTDARPPFSPDDCPAVFTGKVSANPNARYTLLSVSDSSASFKKLTATCRDLLSGATHPANVKSADVLLGLRSLFTPNSTTAYVGLVQDPSATTKGGGWVNFDGTAVEAQLWKTDQPDDGSSANEGRNENFGELTTSGFNDVSATKNTKLICECDGVAVPGGVDTILTALGVL